MTEPHEWDMRFLRLAELVALWSKDPSTKVGAVIVDPLRRIVSTGYNGFPRGVTDDTVRLEERETKYEIVIHAEINAILFAQRPLAGCTIYTSGLPPCSRCASIIIQSGIRRVVFLEIENSRWTDSNALAARLFIEAHVSYVALQGGALNARS